ncbi:MAG: hypothetical protein KAS52_05265 [Candidatus Heimdallarchaeota archaeon]|nr:hypothetical protein [Candidatus Heimdallarchaeota archaeon]
MSGIILCYTADDDSTDLILRKIHLLQKFVSEIILIVPKSEFIEYKKINQLNFPIKVLELEQNILENEVLAFEMALKQCINDKIIVVPTYLHIEPKRIELLIYYDYPLTTFVGQKGNITSNLFYFDKWKNRFIVQLLRLNGRKKLIELFRISNKTALLRISDNDKIVKVSCGNNTLEISQRLSEKKIISPILFQNPIDVQEIVKLIALLNVMRDDIIENRTISSHFKIGQLLIQSQKFLNSGHYGLAFQAPFFFCKIAEKIGRYPPDWNHAKILELGKISLDEELKSYSAERIESLQIACFNDLKELNPRNPKEIDRIEQEIELLREQLLQDNIDT